MTDHHEEVDSAVLKALVAAYFDRFGRDFKLGDTDFAQLFIEPALTRLGLTVQQEKDLLRAAIAADIELYFGLGPEEARAISQGLTREGISSTLLPPGVDKALSAWDEGGVFKILSGPCQYDEDGKLELPATKLRGTDLIPSGRSRYFCLYEGSSIIICIEDVKVQDRESLHGWYWQVTVQWAADKKSGLRFVETLRKQLEGYLVESRRGKILSSNFEPATLKKYRFGDLAFPTEMQGAVEDLVVAFDNWQSPNCSVDNWGALLIGEPGTGKTTIAGVLLERMTKDCTALYCPASDFLNVQPGVNPQLVIREVLFWARLLSPCLLIIDDFDLVVPQRGGYTDQITSCFMEGLDGLGQSGRIFRLFTSNRSEVIESAVLNRPGRIGTRVLFDGFKDCFPDLLRSQALLHGLPFCQDVLDSVTSTEAYANLLRFVETVTPDIAKNVIDRVELSSGKSFEASSLEKALRYTTRAFKKS